jgi:hypothetical protein
MHDPDAVRPLGPTARIEDAGTVNVALDLGGLTLIGGAAALGVAAVLISTRPVVGQALRPDVATLLIVAAALMLLALPAMYAIQADAVGIPGLVGHALLVVGLLLLVIVSATPLLYPSMEVSTIEHPLVFGLGIALVLGLLLTGVVTWQAGVLPRPAAGLVLAAMAGFFFVFFVAEFLPPAAGQVGTAAFGVLLALGFAWIGFAMWQHA